MSDSLAEVLAAAHALVDELAAAELDGLADEQLLALWRELERLARRLPSLEHRLIDQARTRGLPGAYGCRSLTQFLRGLLRVDPREAAAREHGADAAGPRRTLTGQPLPPAYPHVASAQAAGEIAPRHARVIADTIENLPDRLRAAHAEHVETDLVTHARHFDPTHLQRLAVQLTACLDPDGPAPDDPDEPERQPRHRLTLHRRPDGSGHLRGDCTPELAERLDVLFDTLAAPRPAHETGPDPRSAGQRRHDALLDALGLLQRGDLLPAAGGVAATIVLTMTTDAYTTGRGLARTSHGALIPARDALTWAGAHHRLLLTVLDHTHGITAYSHTQRSFTEQQRLALIARDRGCTFPDCDAPPAWCEAHHLTDYAQGGPTSVDNGTLLCGHHHRTHPTTGWQAQLHNGRITWTPPRWIDPHQTPRINHLHHPDAPPEPGTPTGDPPTALVGAGRPSG